MKGRRTKARNDVVENKQVGRSIVRHVTRLSQIWKKAQSGRTAPPRRMRWSQGSLDSGKVQSAVLEPQTRCIVAARGEQNGSRCRLRE